MRQCFKADDFKMITISRLKLMINFRENYQFLNLQMFHLDFLAVQRSIS